MICLDLPQRLKVTPWHASRAARRPDGPAGRRVRQPPAVESRGGIRERQRRLDGAVPRPQAAGDKGRAEHIASSGAVDAVDREAWRPNLFAAANARLPSAPSVAHTSGALKSRAIDRSARPRSGMRVSASGTSLARMIASVRRSNSSTPCSIQSTSTTVGMPFARAYRAACADAAGSSASTRAIRAEAIASCGTSSAPMASKGSRCHRTVRAPFAPLTTMMANRFLAPGKSRAKDRSMPSRPGWRATRRRTRRCRIGRHTGRAAPAVGTRPAPSQPDRRSAAGSRAAAASSREPGIQQRRRRDRRCFPPGRRHRPGGDDAA